MSEEEQQKTLSKKERKRRKQKERKEEMVEEKTPTQEMVEDKGDVEFNKLVEKFAKSNFICCFEGCKKSTKLIKCDCQFCKKWFCLEHGKLFKNLFILICNLIDVLKHNYFKLKDYKKFMVAVMLCDKRLAKILGTRNQK